MKREVFIIEPHPDDAIASTSGVLFSKKLRSHLLTVSKTQDERDNIDIVEYGNKSRAIMRQKYNIVKQSKSMVPDLHWDLRVECENYNKLIEKYIDMYNQINNYNWSRLYSCIEEFVINAKERDALIVIPLALIHPFHILVMEAACRAVIENEINKENIIFYVDHPYDYFSAGTYQITNVKNYIKEKLNIDILHVNCTGIDQSDVNEIIKEIYGEVHFSEFAGTLEKTKCSLVINARAENEIRKYISFHVNNVLYISSQVKPYNKTGGMGEVVYQLAHSVKENANDVRILLFRYDTVEDNVAWEKIDRQEFQYINGMGAECKCYIDSYMYEDIIYFLMSIEYLQEEYRLPNNDESEDNAVALCDAFVKSVLSNMDYKPTVIHCHDWQTACIPFLMKTKYAEYEYVRDIRTIYTIHFYGYRGIINRKRMMELIGYQNNKCDLCISCNDSKCHFDNIKYLQTEDAMQLHIDNEYVTCMAAGIRYSDYVTTVSEGYADELQGIPDFEKNRLIGIRNGIKISKEIDEQSGFCGINEKNYCEAKLKNKRALQKKVGLNVTPDDIIPKTDKVPLIGLLTRLSVEKGMPDLLESLEELLKMDVQVLIVGDEPNGKQFYTPIIKEFVKRFPGKMQYLPYNAQLEFDVYSGIDVLLMPSLSEACGTSQMMAMNYGVLPALTMISSFKDTVTSFFEHDVVEKGMGFYFFIEDGHTMLSVIRRLIVEFKDNKEKWQWCMWKNIVTRFTWEEMSMKKYFDLYDGVEDRNRNNTN